MNRSLAGLRRAWVRLFSGSVVFRLEFDHLVQTEKKWRQIWKENPSFSRGVPAKQDAEFFYLLSMFPYPSGTLHMGHFRVYTIADIIGRVKRMQGYKVLNPMGWDSFGLPAENAAVARGINPLEWTDSNIANMKQQMENMLADFDWECELKTSDPEYYKWTQKLFLLLYKHNMAYRKMAEINWDPVDKTVLANEQVDAQGRSWRLGALVEKKNLEQWFISTTKFAEVLNADLNQLENWPEYVKTQQTNWIGKSSGADFTFSGKLQLLGETEDISLTVFTTRPETLFSVQFVALGFDHPLVQKVASSDPKLANYIAEKKRQDDQESIEGFELPIKLSLPINLAGQSNETFDIPVFTAPYVLSSYGHGAVMGCPAHDARDFAFWSTISKEDVKVTVFPNDKEVEIELPYTKKSGVLGGEFVGKHLSLSVSEAASSIVADLQAKGVGKETIQYRLRDWLISRQRYWGAPIPIIHCDSCGEVPVPDDQLPVLLPDIPNVAEAFQKGNPLANHKEYVETTCPSCGSNATRDTDTMDTFMDLSWYFFRYLDVNNKKEIFSKDIATKNMPVDLYLGGSEHAILHLLYARFISKFLHSIGSYDSSFANGEPFKTLVTQGMVSGLTYRDKDTKRVMPTEEGVNNPNAIASFEKMSKSKHNGTDPKEVIEEFGADSVRGSIVFQAPLNTELKWVSHQVKGVCRWLEKVQAQVEQVISLQNLAPIQDKKGKKISLDNVEFQGIEGLEILKSHDFSPADFQLYKAKNDYIKLVTSAIDETYTFNTIISDFMKLTNAIQLSKASGRVILDSYITLLTLMAPVSPCIAEESYEKLRKAILGQDAQQDSIFNRGWPKYREVVEPWVEVGVMVDGKKRFTIQGGLDFENSTQEEVLNNLKTLDNYEKWLGNGFQKMSIKKKVVIIQTK